MLVGCGGDPVDVEGTWTVSGTNRTNDCAIENWTENDTFSNVTLELLQAGDQVNGDVTGGGGFYLDLLLGGDGIFRGTVDGDELDMLREGTRSMTSGNCTFTFNADMSIAFTGDLFEGRLTYRSAHNGNSDCAAVTCSSYQDINGTRPPQ